MIRYGFVPRDLIIGLPIPFMSFLRIRFRHKKILANIPITVYPLLLAGGVRLFDEQSECLAKRSYKTQAMIFSAGIWANLFYSFIAVLFVAILTMNVPAASIVFGTILVLRVLWQMALSRPNPEHTLTHDIHHSMQIGMSFSQAGDIGISIGFLLAVMNLLPIFPLDGGRLICAMLGRKSEKWADHFSFATTIILGVMCLYAVFLEGFAVFKLFR